jgi:hypothetical protein
VAADRVERRLERAVDHRHHRAGVAQRLAQIVGPGQLRQRHRDRADADHAEDRRRGLERVAHQDRDPLALADAQRRQRAAHPRDLIGQRAVAPGALALAQRHLVAAAVRQVGVEEAGGEVVVALGHGAHRSRASPTARARAR